MRLGQLLLGIMHATLFDPVLQPDDSLSMQQLPTCAHLPWPLTLARPCLSLQQVLAQHPTGFQQSKQMFRQRASMLQYTPLLPAGAKWLRRKGAPSATSLVGGTLLPLVLVLERQLLCLPPPQLLASLGPKSPRRVQNIRRGKGRS